MRICILEGPEDDCVRIETCYPNTIINIIKFIFLYLGGIVYRRILRQREDGQYGPKHVVAHLAIKYTNVTQLCLTTYSFQDFCV